MLENIVTKMVAMMPWMICRIAINRRRALFFKSSPRWKRALIPPKNESMMVLIVHSGEIGKDRATELTCSYLGCTLVSSLTYGNYNKR